MREADDLLKSRGTRSTLRMGPLGGPSAAPEAPAPWRNESVLVLPLQVGPYTLAIEASRVVEVVPGGVFGGALDPERPVASADLYRSLGVLAPENRETILARADGEVGRGPGRYVAFAVDRADRLLKAPLEHLAPLPWITRERIEVAFVVGVVRLKPGEDAMAFLIDPSKLTGTTPGEEGA
jgi:hypothetical protein